MPTLRASQGGEGAGVCCPSQGWARRLTVLEMERLQGFPGDYTLAPLVSPKQADKRRRHALGNTFAVPVVRWIGERIQLYEEVKKEIANVQDQH